MKETRQKRAHCHTVWLHLCEISRMVKSSETEKKLEVAKGRGTEW